jgi:large subunit ribosomal protein L3
MINAFYGIKIGQSQTFTADGERIPVTEILAEPLTVVQTKTFDKDGYVALKVAFGHRKEKNIKKPVLGQVKDYSEDKNFGPRYLREIRVKTNEDLKDIKAGNKINIADIFKEGDVLHVSGIGIGKGFAGVVKRHHFRGGPRTHGQSDRERAPGSIGQATTPGRVYKGKRMAGRMGGQQVTIKNLKVVGFDKERNIVLVKGLVPGKRKGVLKLYK